MSDTADPSPDPDTMERMVALCRDSLAQSPISAIALFMSMSKTCMQFSEGVSRGRALIKERLGDLPHGLDEGLANLVYMTMLTESACNVLIETLADAMYETWPQAVRDPEKLLTEIQSPGDYWEEMNRDKRRQ